MHTLRILVVGTGHMAANHVRAFQSIPDVEVVGGIDVDRARAVEFCALHGLANPFGSIDDALSWGNFDAVTNVTPDSAHHPTTLPFLRAGKHVMCEKPLADTYPLAQEMAEAAEASGLVNMVNLSYRNVAALQKARSLIASGEIGDIRHIEASYRQSWLVGNHWGDWRTMPTWLWRLSQRHGSKGVLGDVGVHILDFASYAIGMMPVDLQARLATFDKAPGNRIDDYVLDANDSAVMTLTFGNGALGVVHASRFMTGYANTLRLEIFGTDGAIEIEHGPYTTLRMCSGADVHRLAWRDVGVDIVPTNHERFVAAIRAGSAADPDFRHAARLQKVIDGCYEPSSTGAMRLDTEVDGVQTATADASARQTLT